MDERLPAARAIRFRRRYDVGRLRADFDAAAAHAAWVAKPELGRYRGWSALPLHASGGGMGLDAVHGHVHESEHAKCTPTPLLSRCPYVAGLLDELPAPKLRVRLMRLEPGGRIGLHRDRAYGWTQPVLRLHVPVLTHAGVTFLLDGERLTMEPGELWYVDTTRDHEVSNESPADRVHLVIDLVNSEPLRACLGRTWDLLL